MKAFWNLIKHKFFRVPAIVTVSLLVILPLFIFMSRQEQDPRTRADSATSLYFSPESSKGKPITKNVNDEFYVDLMINPGKNLVSVLKLDIIYDPADMNLLSINPIEINNFVFPTILEGPVITDGRIQVSLSVGPDVSNAISNEERVLTIYFEAISPSNKSAISFGDSNVAFSVATDDASGENVISSLTPAYVKIIDSANSTNGTKGKSDNKGKKPDR